MKLFLQNDMHLGGGFCFSSMPEDFGTSVQ